MAWPLVKVTACIVVVPLLVVVVELGPPARIIGAPLRISRKCYQMIKGTFFINKRIIEKLLRHFYHFGDMFIENVWQRDLQIGCGTILLSCFSDLGDPKEPLSVDLNIPAYSKILRKTNLFSEISCFNFRKLKL